MPAVAPVLAEDPACCTEVQQVECIRIGLPLEISASRRDAVCSERLIELEDRLREAQCRDALQDLRNKLHTIDQLYHYKKLNVRNQGPNTRARTGISQQEVRKARAAKKYRRARRAKLALSGAGPWEAELKVLEDDDIRGIQDDDPRAVEKRKRKRGDKAGPAEGRRKISWIWRAADVGGSEKLIDSLRVEWLKSRARKMRWEEEVRLLPEEMCRVLATHRYESNRWQARASAAQECSQDPYVQEGLRAYALKQARIRQSMVRVFLKACQPTAKRASAGTGGEWEGWVDGAYDADAPMEEEEDAFKDYVAMYQLDGEDIGPSHEG